MKREVVKSVKRLGENLAGWYADQAVGRAAIEKRLVERNRLRAELNDLHAVAADAIAERDALRTKFAEQLGEAV